MKNVTAKLRPAPDEPNLGPKTAPEFRLYVMNTRDWAREVQQVIQQMQDAIKELQTAVFP